MENKISTPTQIDDEALNAVSGGTFSIPHSTEYEINTAEQLASVAELVNNMDIELDSPGGKITVKSPPRTL